MCARVRGPARARLKVIRGDRKRGFPERNTARRGSAGDAQRQRRTSARRGHRGADRALLGSRRRRSQETASLGRCRRTARNGDRGISSRRGCPAFHRHDRRPALFGEVGQCLRKPVHRLQGGGSGGQHRSGGTTIGPTDSVIAGRLGGEDGSRTVSAAAVGAARGGRRWSERHQHGDSSHRAHRHEPFDERDPRSSDRPRRRLLDRLPARGARPSYKDDRGVRARISLAGAHRRTAILVRARCRAGAGRLVGAVQDRAQRARLRGGDTSGGHVAGHERSFG